MIAVEARLLTYVEAADRLNLKGSDGAKKKFIQRRVSRGEIVGEDFGHTTKRISELNLQKYIDGKQTLEKRFTRKRK
jgi:hypothetical protein